VLVCGGIDTDLYCLEVVTCLQIRIETLKIVWIVKWEKIEKYTDILHLCSINLLIEDCMLKQCCYIIHFV